MVTLYVLALLCKDHEIVLLRRHNATFGNGMYSIPGGKVEENEPALHAIKREVQEETALVLPESAFTLMHTIHRKGTESNFIALCFKADIAGMQPRNHEPEKHDDLQLVPLNQLPANILPAHKQIIENIQKGIAYSEHGF
ncbi:MAG TPA: NUDIX domain-containing protein [Candidatus Babeliales bacterium]|nr:NUDIX domain-containing protein [Candidatus Babeliales bacterium]